MRYAMTGCIMIAVLVLTGCHQIGQRFMNGFRTSDTDPGSANVSAEQLVTYLNRNSERMQSLRCDDVKVTGKMGLGILRQIPLEASLACEQPRNFRMNVYYIGRTLEVEIGSNQQEFWYWVRRAKPAAQIYCAYEDFKSVKPEHMPLPFQPEWVLETLGMAKFGPAEKYQVVVKSDEVHLIEKTTSPQGKPVRKVIVFNRRRANVARGEPQIKAFKLIDDKTNKEICSAHIYSAQLDRKNYALIPKRMELRWPEEKLSLTLQLVNPQTNAQSFTQQDRNNFFTRRTPTGIPSFNLALRRFDAQPSSLQRTRAQLQTRWRGSSE